MRDNGIDLIAIDGSVSMTRVDASDNHGIGIRLNDVGAVQLNDVTGNNNDLGNLDLERSGDVVIQSGSFNNSRLARGIRLDRAGSVTITDVTATGNQEQNLDVELSDSLFVFASKFDHSMTGTGVDVIGVKGAVTMTGVSADSNEREGIKLRRIDGNVALTNVSAVNNRLDNLQAVLIPVVNINQSSFNASHQGNGVFMRRIGALVAIDVLALNNAEDGLFVRRALSVTILGGVFNDNEGCGIHLRRAGNVQLLGATATGNGIEDIC